MSQHGYPERLSNRSKGFQEDGPSQPTMEVLVETLTGTAFEMTVSPSDTIFAIKSKIFRVEGIPVSQQHLVYNLRELADGASLRDHGVAAGARLRLVLALRGGPVTTRRPPPPEIPPPDRDDIEWSGEGGSGGGGECKVAVLVFRDGERVNMVRMRENRDGTFSPLDHAKYSSSLSHLVEHEDDECVSGALPENAVTMGKMLDLRRRMESLSLHRRRNPHRSGDQVDIQKTRSEETLSVSSLLEDTHCETYLTRSGYDCYKRYDCDCAYADRYTLLPPIGHAHSNHSLNDTLADTDRFKLPETLAGSILVKGREADEEAAILEEGTEGDECRRDTNYAPTSTLAPLPAPKYGALVGGEVRSWRRGFGSSSQLAGGAAAAADVCAGLRPPPPHRAPPLSASTSDLETLTRNRILPALSRHRNREHLHLSDDRLELSPHVSPQPQPQPQCQPQPQPRRLRCALCRRRLGAATEHRCRCGGAYCAPHRYAEVHGCNYDYKTLSPHHN
ncbi:uncharacterized protein LOC106713167 [Papilio machaon]|uniref:uncharacterized protein LOC106713167 n=1 Tax=Papilio machaon TaxID=76193 RepID=UPI001E665471|nr:uncharacterized protein LOC106713167 [Papilio machaon]